MLKKSKYAYNNVVLWQERLSILPHNNNEILSDSVILAGPGNVKKQKYKTSTAIIWQVSIFITQLYQKVENLYTHVYTVFFSPTLLYLYKCAPNWNNYISRKDAENLKSAKGEENAKNYDNKRK